MSMKKNRLPRLEVGDKDCFNRIHKSKKTSNYRWHDINNYWKNSPLYESFINKSFYDGVCCMACGSYHDYGKLGKFERAHITCSFYGGSNYESNLHILCRKCHLGSEMLDGWVYWLWLGLKSQLYENGTLNSYEYDYPDEETCKADDGKMSKELLIPYEYGSAHKIKEYAKDIVLLNQIEGMLFKEDHACLILHKPELFRLKCEFKNLEEILKIDETLHLNPLSEREVIEKFGKKIEDVGWRKHI